jgi:Major Facilitator Superfamily
MALVLDAASFAFSGIVTWLGVRQRPAARTGVPGDTARTAGAMPPSRLADLTGTFRLIVTHPALSRLAAFTLTACCLIAPESLAAPYAASLGGGPAGTGLFLAAFPVGFTIGGIVMMSVADPARLLRLIAPGIALAAVPLACFAAHPGLPASILLWAVSGLLSAPVIAVNAAFVRTVPDDRRGTAGALMGSVVSGGQGLVMAAAGGVAEFLGLPGTVAAFGVIVAVCAVLTSAGWRAARAVALAALAGPAEQTEPAEPADQTPTAAAGPALTAMAATGMLFIVEADHGDRRG